MDKFTVRNSDGTVNVDASNAAYRAALVNWVAENEVSPDLIGAAVARVFDAHPNERLHMDALVWATFSEMNGTPAQHKVLTSRIRDFLQNEKKEGRINVKLGLGGGVLRS